MSANDRSAQERRDKRVRSQERSSPLPDPRHERLLVGKRVPAGFIGDFLEACHISYTDDIPETGHPWIKICPATR